VLFFDALVLAIFFAFHQLVFGFFEKSGHFVLECAKGAIFKKRSVGTHPKS